MKNPQAFPGVQYISIRGDKNPEGMTLRDYFAAKAMPAILEQMDVCNGKELSNSAWIAYQMADAMLKAREA